MDRPGPSRPSSYNLPRVIFSEDKSKTKPPPKERRLSDRTSRELTGSESARSLTERSFSRWELTNTQLIARRMYDSKAPLFIATEAFQSIIDDFPLVDEKDPISILMPPFKNKPQSITLGDIIVEKVLHDCKLGAILQIRNTNSDKQYAIKVYEKSKISNDSEFNMITAEFHALMSLSGKGIFIKLYATFQTIKCVGLLLELVKGPSFTEIKGKYTEKHVSTFVAQLARGIEYMHTSGIIHCDISAEHVMVTKAFEVKLINFASCIFTPTSTVKCGSPMYMSPEMNDSYSYSYEIDWWSFGVLTNELMTGHFPDGSYWVNLQKEDMATTSETLKGKKSSVMKANDDDYLILQDNLSKDAKDLVAKLLELDPMIRLGHGENGFRNIKNHPFFKLVNWNIVSADHYTAE